MSRILSAVAWPYANGPRHIGHVAGFGVPSDIFSRYMRMAGNEVLMVSGTDEHGAPWVSWVLDEGDVVGDNNHDWVSPRWSAVASVLEGRPARRLAGTPVAGADRGGDP